MAKRKQEYAPPSYFTAGKTPDGRKDSFFPCFQSLIHSKAFIDLTARQRCLYIYLASKQRGCRRPERDYPDVQAVQGEDKFYFQFREALATGLYAEGGKGEFYGDLQTLESHGFISRIVSGHPNRKKSIYQYSEAWKLWEKQEGNNERIKGRMKAVKLTQSRLAEILGMSKSQLNRLLASELPEELASRIDGIIDGI